MESRSIDVRLIIMIVLVSFMVHSTVAQIAITEISIKPDHHGSSQGQTEYAEFFNYTDSTVDLTNWQYCSWSTSSNGTNSGCETFPVGTMLASGEYLIQRKSSAGSNKTDDMWGTDSLVELDIPVFAHNPNARGTASLVDADGNTVWEFSYDNANLVVQGHEGQGIQLREDYDFCNDGLPALIDFDNMSASDDYCVATPFDQTTSAVYGCNSTTVIADANWGDNIGTPRDGGYAVCLATAPLSFSNPEVEPHLDPQSVKRNNIEVYYYSVLGGINVRVLNDKKQESAILTLVIYTLEGSEIKRIMMDAINENETHVFLERGIYVVETIGNCVQSREKVMVF